ncbi:MAG: TrmB family transcriptional regulator [Candidatus Thermoplasmatota archaeon]|jgi:sugar-specific transcriptional regulator TrmB|nr:TrmB family transcriptional regulator [Candidatus Thermoplasmatota archaeon]MCL5989337.1 TrmB family transcriptional regulator [Candidatus Thermoplasmatota archaeon]
MTNSELGSNQNHANIISILEDIGLTENETKVYILLLGYGSMAAQDILHYLPLRQPQLYDITSSLERKGFINVLLGRPKRYEALDPEAVIEAREQILSKNRKYFLNWANRAMEARRETTALINAKNIRSVINNSISLINETERTLEIETTQELYSYIAGPILRKIQQGCRVELLFFGQEVYPDKLKSQFADIDIDVRHVTPGQFFTIISDEKNSVFMPRSIAMNTDIERYGYVIRDKDMTWFITHNFFTGWYGGDRIKDRSIVSPYTYYSQRILISDLKRISDKCRRVKGILEGVVRSTDDRFASEGEVTDINSDTEIINFTFRTEKGTYTVGGYDSQLEDIVMKSFMLTSPE